MPQKFSKKLHWSPLVFEVREYSICSGACVLPERVLIVTLLSQSTRKHSQESLSSVKCVVPYCGPTSEHTAETDVWTFAVKLSHTGCQRHRNIPKLW